MGFFKLYKPREYKPRFIYYDPKKEAQKEREEKYAKKDPAEEPGEFKTSIRRGSFREQRNEQRRVYRDHARQANIRLIIIIAVMLLIAYFILK